VLGFDAYILVGSSLIGCQIENMNPDVTPYRMSLDVCISAKK